MATKTTGAEFKRFYSDDSFWRPPGRTDTWHEDEAITVKGEAYDGDIAAMADDALVTISGGWVMGVSSNGEALGFETFFKRWRKQQTTVSFLVECDIENAESIKAAIRAAGGTII